VNDLMTDIIDQSELYPFFRSPKIRAQDARGYYIAGTNHIDYLYSDGVIRSSVTHDVEATPFWESRQEATDFWLKWEDSIRHKGDVETWRKAAEYWKRNYDELEAASFPIAEHEKALAEQREACMKAAYQYLDPINWPIFTKNMKDAILSASVTGDKE